MQTTAIDYQALYEQGLLEAQKAQAIINDLQGKLALTLFEFNRTRRLLFGRSADNRASKANDPNQITLFDLSASEEDLQSSDTLAKQEAEKIAKQEGKAKAAPKPRENNQRMDLPVDLPREEITIHPNVDLADYTQIGEEVSEVLEITPASFYVKRIIRTKWVRKTLMIVEPDAVSNNIIIAPLPARTVARGIFGDSLLAYLVISKYCDHLPLHRLIKIFERVGIRLAASTLSDNIAAVCRLLEPLYNSLRREVLANRYIQCDETRLRVQDGEKSGACHFGYIWAYHAPVSKLVLFDYQTGRGQEGPAKLLADFEGVLQADGYAVYGSLFADSRRDKSSKVTLAACWAHVRRKFDEAFSDDRARAKYALEKIAKLYVLEQEIRDAGGMEERAICQLRLKVVAPVLDEFKVWMEVEYGKILPNSPIGKAIAYTLKLWDRLTVYLYHGELQIDNNLIENCIRPIALGRKNFLFCGSHAAAQNTAMLYSFMGSCQRNCIPPQLWLADVLAKLNDPNYEGKFSDLLPNQWVTPSGGAS